MVYVSLQHANIMFNLTTYNLCNWTASFTLIYPDAIRSSSYLTCPSVFHLSYCIYPTSCSIGGLDGFIFFTYDGTALGYLEVPHLFSLGALYRFTIGTYDGTYLRSLEISTEVIAEGNFEVLFLGDWLLSVVGLVIGVMKLM